MASNFNNNKKITDILLSSKKHTVAPFHGTEAEWAANNSYVPALGEIVIYDIDDNYSYERFKIGDGKTRINYLNFSDSNKMDKNNPVGTGSFSLNRKVGSTIGNCSFAEGSGTEASGSYSHAEGANTIASGSSSHAEGYSTTASGPYSHAEGAYTIASKNCAHAEGSSAEASGTNSHAEGSDTEASGAYSHAEGKNTIASGEATHAEGSNTIASGSSSHAEGYNTAASGSSSHAEGLWTTASGSSSHVQGRYNVEDTTNTYAHIVGNGNDTKRSNAHTLDWSGNAWFRGNIYTGSTSGTNKDSGSKKLATEEYADTAANTVKNDLLNGAGAAYDTLKELGDLISENVNAIDALETIAANKADKVHLHEISDVVDLQSTLGNKANAGDLTSHVNNKSNPHAVTAAQTGALSLAGGSLNDGASIKLSLYGNRFLTINGNAITADMSQTDGGWAGNFASVKDPSGTTTAMLGWYGGTSGLTHIYMGGTYSDPAMKMTPAGQFTFKNTPYVGTTKVALTSDINYPVTSVNEKTGNVSLTASDVGADASGSANTALTNAKTYADGLAANKVDKINGKGLSTNDYTTTEKNKLAGIENGANKTVVDTALSSTSTNPVQNKVVNTALNNKMDKTNPTGTGSFSIGRKANTTIGSNSFAMGIEVTASGDYSHAEGYSVTATGTQSHAEGHGDNRNITITGEANTNTYSLSETNSYIDIGGSFIKYGNAYARITAYDSTALTITVDKTLSTTTLTNASALLIRGIAFGSSSHAEGSYTSASGSSSHAEGSHTSASGSISHAEGYATKAFGDYSHAEGKSTTASGNYSHAEGESTTASGVNSHAEGYDTTASGKYSHAEGQSTTASGNYSHAEGQSTTASGDYSHAEGKSSKAFEDYAHAEGNGTESSNYASHSEGVYTIASGYASHAEGYNTIASGIYSHTQGRYNIEDTTNTYAHIVGNGNDTKSSNAHTLDWSGNAWFQGDVYIGSTSGTNKDSGSKILATQDYVNTKVADLVNSAPTTLDTLKELSTALGDDPNFATTIATQMGNKVDKVSGKGLSTNDYTTAEKNKLAGIATGANKTVVDTALSSSSTNPVQNKVVHTALNTKADKTQGIFYIEGGGTTDTTNKVATWTGSHDDIESYYTGLMIAYKIGTAASTTTTLNINSLGAVTVVRNATTAISTVYPVGSVIFLIYDANDGTPYWKAHEYDANTRNTVGDYRKNGTKLYFVGSASSDAATTSSYATSYTNSNIYVNTSNVLCSAEGFSGDLAGNADTATKATQDASGNVITSTYATKTELSNKVDKVSGKGLSTNDYTTTEKNKLASIAENANNYSLPTASSSTLGGVKTTSTVTSTSGLTACPIISGVPYYKDTNNTYTLSSFGITATAAELNKLDGVTATATELNYVDGVTSAIQTQLNGKAASSHNQAASTITAGTFAGQVVANSSGQTYSTSLLRNCKLVSTATNPAVSGEICWQYE